MSPLRLLLVAAVTSAALTAADPDPPLPPRALARLGETKFRHGFMVNQVVFSPDGKQLASAGNGRGLCLWEPTTGKLLRDLSQGRMPATYGVAFSPDGQQVVTTDGNPVRIWDTSTGKTVRELVGHTNGVMGVAWSDNGKWIATGSHDATIRIWDPSTGKTVHELTGHTRLPRQVAFAPGSKLLASAGLDGTLRTWDPITGKEQQCFQDVTNGYTGLTFSPDGKLLVWLTQDGNLYGWATDNKSAVRKWINDEVGGWSVAFSPDGRTLATGWRDGSVRLFDVETRKETRRWFANNFAVSTLTYSLDGKTLVTGGNWASALRRWDPATGKEIGGTPTHTGSVDRLKFLSGDKTLLSFGRDHQIIRWDLATGKSRARTLPLRGTIAVTALSRDGQRLAMAGRLKSDLSVALYDTETGKEVQRFEGLSAPLAGMGFANNNPWLALANQDGTVSKWDLTTGKQRWLLDEKMGGRSLSKVFHPIQFSPDDRFLLSAGVDRSVRLYDAKSGKLLLKHERAGEIDGVDFSPDGALAVFAGGYNNPAIRLWDTQTGRIARTWASGQSGIYGVAFSADGRLLATAGDDADSSVKLWDVATGQELAQFKGHHSSVMPVAFSGDGRTLASGGGDATVVLWDVTGRRGKSQAALSPKKLQELWDTLADADAKKAHAAAWELALSPDGGVAFLRGRVEAVKAADEAEVDRLVKQLGSDEFTARQSATQALGTLGGRAFPRLRQVLVAKPELEVRKRIEAVLASYQRSDEWHRCRQALAVLEWGGGVAARQLVDELARGAAGAPLTEEARAVSARLSRGGR